jgi:hypothetical protein
MKDIIAKSLIKIALNGEEQIYNRFTVIDGIDDDVKINDDIINYLYSAVENVPAKNKIAIEVFMPDKTADKLNIIEKLIKKHIADKISAINKQTVKFNRHSIILAFIGMFLIGISQVMQIMGRRHSLTEFIVVMSWVFMWKAVEIFFFDKMKIIKKRTNLTRIYNAEYQLYRDNTA